MTPPRKRRDHRWDLRLNAAVEFGISWRPQCLLGGKLSAAAQFRAWLRSQLQVCLLGRRGACSR